MMLPVRSQREVRNILWKFEEERSLRCRGRNLILLPAVMWKVKNVPSELSHLAKEISKYRAEGAAWCFLVAYREMQEDRDILREVLINKKESGIDEFLSLSRWQTMLKLRNTFQVKIKSRALPGSSPS